MKFKSSHRSLIVYLIIATALQLSYEAESCTKGAVQLVGGQNMFEGRVVVCDGGQWKTVCDRGWRKEEAKVVCRQLNYSDSLNATYVRRGCAGQGFNQDTLKVVWNCSGQESNLLACNMTQTTSTCDHRRDAGVYCSGQTRDDCEEDTLRLVDGPSNASGRVEVCRFGCGGTVCDEGWDRNSSLVACRDLGFETEQAIPVRGGYFSNVSYSRQIHVSRTDCGKDANKLVGCSKFGLNQCTHSRDAGIICNGTSMCQDGEVKLVDHTEFEGRVEMCYNGVWGAVCANGWDNVAANIICNQLGYRNYIGLPLKGIGPGNSSTLFNSISCSEPEHSMLFQCVDMDSIGVYDCGENNVARVSCEMPNPDVTTISMQTTTSQTITGLTLSESSTISNSQSEVLRTNTDMTTSAVPNSRSDMTPLSATSDSLSVILGAVGGLLATGAITATSVASVIITVVVIRKQKRKMSEKGSAMNNPTYDECHGTTTLNNLTINHDDSEYEKEFDNPIYSDETEISHNPADKTKSQLQNTPHYEGVYFEGTDVFETLYEGADNGIQGTLNGTINNTSTANDEVIMKGATSEGVYELPSNLDGAAADDENCYSTLDPTYSQLEPHLGIPKPGVEINCPPNDDNYSHLKYK